MTDASSEEGGAGLAARAAAAAIVGFARAITAVRAVWSGVAPEARQRVYFANHTSNGDFVLVWTALPPRLRRRTRPVAAADYWLRSRLRSWIARDVFRAVLIERLRERRVADPVAQMLGALDEGDSLILFPEGGRNPGPEPLLPFRAGLYNLALARPAVELVPAWIENLNRVLPKGEIVPVPLACAVTFGRPVAPRPGEGKDAFLARARDALLAAGGRAAEPAP